MELDYRLGEGVQCLKFRDDILFLGFVSSAIRLIFLDPWIQIELFLVDYVFRIQKLSKTFSNCSPCLCTVILALSVWQTSEEKR